MITPEQQRAVWKWADENENSSDMAAALSAAYAVAGQLAIMRADPEIIEASEAVMTFLEKEIFDFEMEK